MSRILYLCDGRACGETCPNEDCHHTAKWERALHKDADFTEFEKVPLPDGSYMFVERNDED